MPLTDAAGENACAVTVDNGAATCPDDCSPNFRRVGAAVQIDVPAPRTSPDAPSGPVALTRSPLATGALPAPPESAVGIPSEPPPRRALTGELGDTFETASGAATEPTRRPDKPDPPVAVDAAEPDLLAPGEYARGAAFSDDSLPDTMPGDPADPVPSANANGIAATAAPTPNATANAPTRPT